jgi:NAD(P)H-dependent flavin oxidoreductase YrpB (nitropropane dioxygenase family)
MAEEASAHPLYRARLIAAGETDTVHTALFDGGWPDAPLRCLVNSTVRAWQAAGSPPSGRRPGEGEAVATDVDGTPIHRYSSIQPATGMSGEIEAMVLYAGQGVGLYRRLQPAASIIAEIMDGAVEAIARLSK